jgi:hypothetical protein
MSLQEKMFAEVQIWLASGISKRGLMADKDFGVPNSISG